MRIPNGRGSRGSGGRLQGNGTHHAGLIALRKPGAGLSPKGDAETARRIVLRGSEINGTGFLELIVYEVSDARKEAPEPLVSDGFHRMSCVRNGTSRLTTGSDNGGAM